MTMPNNYDNITCLFSSLQSSAFAYDVVVNHIGSGYCYIMNDTICIMMCIRPLHILW